MNESNVLPLADHRPTSKGIHPLLRKKRPPITTPPILLLANAIRGAIEDGHQGLRVLGSARSGKTYAQRWLMERTGWHTKPMARVSIRVPRHAKVRDGYVYQLILMSCRQKLFSRFSDLDALARIRDLFEQMCYSAKANTLLMLVDEAQRLHSDELADFLSIVNECEWGDNSVFIVFFYQTDLTGSESERIREELAPHLKGRFGMADHRFHGLRGEDEIASVLKRYDNNAKWPIGSNTTYTQYFASNAHAHGWRLVQHTKEIIDTIEQLRASHGLPPLDEWPMKSFELFVQRALTRVVTRPGFEGLTRDDITETLDSCGYMKLERCRAHMMDDDEE